MEGPEVSLLSPETIAVFKRLFFRSKDLVDLQRFVATVPQLDHAYSAGTSSRCSATKIRA